MGILMRRVCGGREVGLVLSPQICVCSEVISYSGRSSLSWWWWCSMMQGQSKWVQLWHGRGRASLGKQRFHRKSYARYCYKRSSYHLVSKEPRPQKPWPWKLRQSFRWSEEGTRSHFHLRSSRIVTFLIILKSHRAQAMTTCQHMHLPSVCAIQDLAANFFPCACSTAFLFWLQEWVVKVCNSSCCRARLTALDDPASTLEQAILKSTNCPTWPYLEQCHYSHAVLDGHSSKFPDKLPAKKLC